MRSEKHAQNLEFWKGKRTKDGRNFGDLATVYYLNCFDLQIDEYKISDLKPDAADADFVVRRDGERFDFFTPRAVEFFGSLFEAQKTFKQYLEFSLDWHKKQIQQNVESKKMVQQKLINLEADMAEYRTAPMSKDKDEKRDGFRL